MTSERQCGAGTSMGWYHINDDHIIIDIECRLTAAPGILTNLAQGLRQLATDHDPAGLALADAINAVGGEIKTRGEG